MYNPVTAESRCPQGIPESTTEGQTPNVMGLLNPRQRRKLRPNGSPANVPSCPGTSGQLRSLTSFADPPSALAEVTRVCFPKLTQAVLWEFRRAGVTSQMAISNQGRRRSAAGSVNAG